MADNADIADGVIQFTVDAEVERLRNTGPEFTPVGYCIWCHDKVPEGYTHCPPDENDCQEMHARFIKFNKGND